MRGVELSNGLNVNNRLLVHPLMTQISQPNLSLQHCLNNGLQTRTFQNQDLKTLLLANQLSRFASNALFPALDQRQNQNLFFNNQISHISNFGNNLSSSILKSNQDIQSLQDPFRILNQARQQSSPSLADQIQNSNFSNISSSQVDPQLGSIPQITKSFSNSPLSNNSDGINEKRKRNSDNYSDSPKEACQKTQANTLKKKMLKKVKSVKEQEDSSVPNRDDVLATITTMDKSEEELSNHENNNEERDLANLITLAGEKGLDAEEVTGFIANLEKKLNIPIRNMERLYQLLLKFNMCTKQILENVRKNKSYYKTQLC